MGNAKKILGSPIARAVSIALVAFLGVTALRSIGSLEFVELSIYDALVRASVDPRESESLVALITVQESDIQRHGHPLSDAVLAEAIERLAALEARMIGVDLYRDRPVPPGAARLERAFADAPNVVALLKFGSPGVDGVPAPPFLPSDRSGFSDLPVDSGGMLRRGLLYLWDDEGDATVAFALRLALGYLAPEGLSLGPAPGQARCVQVGAKTLCPLDPSSGGYRNADARGFQFLLDFRDGSEAFPVFSLGDLMQDRIPAESVRGRVAILGTAAASVRDEFYTPLSEGLRRQSRTAYGAEIHAHAVSQLIRYARGTTPPVRTLGETTEAGLVLISALLCALLALGIRSAIRLAITLGGVACVAVVAATFAFRAGWWAPMAAPALAGTASLGLVVLHLAWQERQEKLLIRDLFARTLGKKVAEELWRKREQFMSEGTLRPQLAVISVLMSDLKGFTPAAEKMDPMALMEWVNDYMRAMTCVVEKHGGVLDDFAGDGIKADFGVPIPRTSSDEMNRDAENAVTAALEMAREVGRLNTFWRDRDLPTGRVRIGICTGPAVMGGIGAGTRMKYTTLGDTVTTAARLESFDKDGFSAEVDPRDCRILISEATLRRLGGRFATERVGEFVLPGRSGKTTIHRVIEKTHSRGIETEQSPGRTS